MNIDSARRRFIYLIAAFIIILGHLPCFAQTLTGKVVSIADGDTFTMLVEGNKQVKIRLHGIDCPEKNQDFGQVAKKFLSDLIYGKTVIVQEMDLDRYGRTIGLVKVNDQVINENLLEAGLAWHYKRYDQNLKWAELETRAREEKKGLWSRSDAIAPWEYRKKAVNSN